MIVELAQIDPAGAPHGQPEADAITKLIVCAVEGRPERDFLAAQIRRAYGPLETARRRPRPGPGAA